MSRYVKMMGPKPTWAAKFEARGRALVGHLLTNPTIVYDSMGTSLNWLRSGTVPPTIAKDATTEGGAHQMDTTAVAGQNSDLYWSNLAGAARSSMIRRPSLVPWYQAWRVSFDTAIDAAAFMTGGLQDAGLATSGPRVGVNGSTSTAKFSGLSGANSALSSVAIAIGIFEFEFWGVGSTTLQFRVNGESPVPLTYGEGAVDGWAPKFATANGATAAARTWRLLDHIIMTNGL